MFYKDLKTQVLYLPHSQVKYLNGKACGTTSMCITHVFNDHSHQGDLFCVHGLIFIYEEREEQGKKNTEKSDVGKIVTTIDSTEVTKHAVM